MLATKPLKEKEIVDTLCGELELININSTQELVRKNGISWVQNIIKDIEVSRRDFAVRSKVLAFCSPIPLVLALIVENRGIGLLLLIVAIAILGASASQNNFAFEYAQPLSILYAVTGESGKVSFVVDWLRRELAPKYGRYSLLPKSTLFDNEALLMMLFTFIYDSIQIQKGILSGPFTEEKKNLLWLSSVKLPDSLALVQESIRNACETS